MEGLEHGEHASALKVVDDQKNPGVGGEGVGGGVIDALEDEMLAIITETAQDYSMTGAMEGVEILAAKAGDDAGITGGAVLARRETK